MVSRRREANAESASGQGLQNGVRSTKDITNYQLRKLMLLSLGGNGIPTDHLHQSETTLLPWRRGPLALIAERNWLKRWHRHWLDKWYQLDVYWPSAKSPDRWLTGMTVRSWLDSTVLSGFNTDWWPWRLTLHTSALVVLLRTCQELCEGTLMWSWFDTSRKWKDRCKRHYLTDWNLVWNLYWDQNTVVQWLSDFCKEPLMYLIHTH